jgi:GPH family glycoside/pentoside/hexuronide:cation symporter
MIEEASLSLLNVMSGDSKERFSINTYKILGGILAALAAQYLGLELVGLWGAGSERKGYFFVAVFFGALALMAILFGAKHVKERYVPESHPQKLLHSMKILFTDKRLTFVLLFYFCHQFASSVKTQASTYYMKYYIDRPDLTQIFLLVSLISSLAVQPLITVLAKKLNANMLIICGFIVAFVGMLTVGFAGPNVPLMLAGTVMLGVSTAFPANLIYIAIANIADSYVKKGNNMTALLNSYLGLVSKVAVSSAGSIIAIILQMVNYIPNAAQTGPAVDAIQAIFVTFTAFWYLLAAVFAVASAIAWKRVKS